MNIPATRKHMVRCARRRSEHHAAPRQSSSRATQLNLATTSAQLWKTTRCTERVGGMINSARHLAQFNIARIRYPLDDQRMAEFVDNVTRVNGLADKIPGFVWRQQDESGHAMNIQVYDDPTILPNLTVWENVEALDRFVWQTLHQRFYARREEWFEPIKTTLVLWWIPA